VNNDAVNQDFICQYDNKWYKIMLNKAIDGVASLTVNVIILSKSIAGGMLKSKTKYYNTKL